MARRRRRVGGVAVSLAAAVSPWWHARASVSGHCDASSGEERFDHRFAFDHGCSASLSAYSARVELAGTVAQVLVNETFTNEAQYSIEDASLALSIPAGAIILGFWTEITGSDVVSAQALHGEVRMRQGLPNCPRTTWGGVSDAVGVGHPGTLRLTLGRIPPSASLNVRLEYVQEVKPSLKPRRGAVLKVNLQLPSGARKKTSQRKAQDTSSVLAIDVVVAAEKSNTGSCSSEPAAASGSGAAETCRASSAAPGAVEITSPSHGTALKAVPNAADHAGAAQLRADVLQDVVLEVALDADVDLVPHLYVEQHPTLATAVAALWLPPAIAATSHSNLEVILILDRSPSMLGTRLDRIRQAARTFLRSVPVAGSLNLMGFAASEAPLFKEASQRLSKDTFQSASDYIATALDSRAGERGVPGAQGAVAAALKDLKRDAGTQLRIFFITDRHVPDGDAVLRDIATHCGVGSCQVSTLGLGWGASPQFVENAARAGHGTARFVAERGGVEPLERTLVAQLAEALQPAVRDVDVAWAEALNEKSAEGVVSLLSRRPGQNDEALENDLQRFYKQGGVRDLLSVPIDLPAVAAGDRLLAAAFLGRITEDVLAQQSVLVHATIGGVQTSRKARVSFMKQGTALHALCASQLTEALERRGTERSKELAGVDDRDWQLQALGLTYDLTTAQSQWLALPGAVANLVTVGGQPLLLERSDSVHCTGPRGMSAADSFSPYSSGRAWDLDPAANLGRSQAQAPGAELSMRRPGGVARAASLSIQSYGRLMPRLSTLDFTEIGSSVALRRLSTGSNPWGSSALDLDAMGSSLSLRNLMYGKLFEGYDLQHVGASLAIKQPGKGWGYDFLDGAEDMYGGDYGRFRDPWSQSLHGSGMAVRSFDRLAGKDKPKPDDSLSLRSFHKCGSKLSLLSTSRFAAKFSAVDFTELGSSLALRHLHQPPGISPYRFGTLAMLDYSCMSSSLSLGGWGFGRRSLSLQGSSRFHGMDMFGYGMDGGPADLPELRGASTSSLSLRSFPRMGKTLAVLDTAEDSASSRHARLASQLGDVGAADVGSIGSALALRPLGRPFAGKAAGRRGQPPDLEHLASSLSLRRLSTGHNPLEYGELGAAWGSLNDLVGPAGDSALAGFEDSRKKSSDGLPAAEISSPWDDYPPRYGSLGMPSTRSTGRIGSKLSVVGDGKAVGSSGASVTISEKQPRPDAWVGVGIAGGLMVPVLAIWRSGSICQASSEEVQLEWPSSEAAVKGLAPAVVYAASGPVVEDATVRLAELAAPTEGSSRASIAFQLSHSCVLTARKAPAGGSKSQGGKALLEVSLAKTTLPAATTVTGEALAAALKKNQFAHSPSKADTDSGNAGPVAAEVVSTGATTATSSAGAGRLGDYHSLLDMQLFDGSFDLSKMSAEATTGIGLDSNLMSLFVKAYSSGTGNGKGALIAHTAIALAVLRTRHMIAEDVWALIASKAEAWLAGADSGGESHAENAPPRCIARPELCVAAAQGAVVGWATSPLRPTR